VSVQLYNGTGGKSGDSVVLSSASKYAKYPALISDNVYYIELSSSGSGTCTIAFSESAMSEMDSAPQLSFDVWANGEVNTGAEQWFAFTATATTQYIHVSFGTLTDLYVQLYDPTTGKLGSSVELSNSTGSTKYTSKSSLTSGNLYYVTVSPVSSGGTYKIGFNGSISSP
jgi:hypothetical protein